jgi:DivIVA domain-containing protein
VLTLLVVLAVAGILFVAAVVATQDSLVLAEALPDDADLELPSTRLVSEDLRAVRFAMVFRGYRMSQVDDVLDRVGEELAARDERIADLERVLAEIVEPALREVEEQQAEPAVDLSEPTPFGLLEAPAVADAEVAPEPALPPSLAPTLAPGARAGEAPAEVPAPAPVADVDEALELAPVADLAEVAPEPALPPSLAPTLAQGARAGEAPAEVPAPAPVADLEDVPPSGVPAPAPVPGIDETPPVAVPEPSSAATAFGLPSEVTSFRIPLVEEPARPPVLGPDDEPVVPFGAENLLEPDDVDEAPDEGAVSARAAVAEVFREGAVEGAPARAA